MNVVRDANVLGSVRNRQVPAPVPFIVAGFDSSFQSEPISEPTGRRREWVCSIVVEEAKKEGDIFPITYQITYSLIQSHRTNCNIINRKRTKIGTINPTLQTKKGPKPNN